jgi:hypothetical protein
VRLEPGLFQIAAFGSTPSSSAAEAVTSLNVEPGGYSWSFAFESSGRFGSFVSRLYAAVADLTSCDASSFGSNVGLEAIARISPVEGSIATTAPSPAFWSSRAATSCRFGSIVVTTLAPFRGRPRIWSTRVDGRRSVALPERKSL